MTASRHDISKVLYESLPPAAKACIEVDRNVTSVAVDADGSGASVTCADGTTYHGSVVIGADGVHSMVRRHIGAERRGAPLDAEEPFESRFRCLWIRFPTDLCAALQPGDSSETHGPGASTQMFAGPETAVTAVYERLPGPTRQRARYTQADEEALVERWGHLPIMAGRALTIRRAYESRTSASLLNLEEGVVDDWSARGRLVLIGDSAHKFTPNTGSGCNQGILDAVALANQLHKAIEESAGGAPSTERLDKAFGDYQDERKPGVTTHCSRSGYSAVVSTWSSALLGFADRWIFCWAFFLALIIHRASVREAKMPVLRFVQGEERYQGKIPWVNKIPPVQS